MIALSFLHLSDHGAFGDRRLPITSQRLQKKLTEGEGVEKKSMKDMGTIMSPRSVAVVGATNRPGSVGLHVFRNILNAGYRGILYPVNPRQASVQSVKAYPCLEEIPDPVDLAVIIVPAEIVPSIIKEAARKQVKGLIVVSAGSRPRTSTQSRIAFCEFPRC